MTVSDYIAERVGYYRRIRKIKQIDLASNISISRSQLANLEAGITRTKPEIIYEIANHLNIDISQLMPDMDWYLSNK